MSRPLYIIEPGSELSLDGRRWLVLRQTSAGYDVEGLNERSERSGERLHLPFGRVDDAFKAGLCRVTTSAAHEMRTALLRFTGGLSEISQLSAEAQKWVTYRLEMVSAILTLEERGDPLTQRYLDLPEVREEIAEIVADQRTAATGKRRKRTVTDYEAERLPSGRTLMKYLKLYKQYGRNPIALMKRDNLKGPPPEKRAKLSDAQRSFLGSVIEQWLKPTKPAGTAVYNVLAAVYREAAKAAQSSGEAILSGFVAPSITTFRNYLKRASEVAKVVGREGRKQAANRVGAGSTATRALRYGELVEIDEVYLSLFIDSTGQYRLKKLNPKEEFEKLKSDELFRCWFSCAADVASGMPLGWTLSKTTGAEHTSRVLNLVNQDKRRLALKYGCTQQPALPTNPLRIAQDNGTALRNGTVRAGQLGAGMIVNDARTHHAIDKPFIERLFGILETEVIGLIPGYAGRRPGHLTGASPKADAILTPDDLYRVLTRYFVDEYPFRPKSGTGMFGATPHARMLDIIEQYGAIPPLDRAARRACFGHAHRVKVTKQGVKIDGLAFNSTALQVHRDLRPRDMVEVRLDPTDLRDVTIFPTGGGSPILAQIQDTSFADSTLEEVLAEAHLNAAKAIADDPKLQDARARRGADLGLTAHIYPPGYLPSAAIGSELKHLLKVSERPSSAPEPILPNGTGAPPSVTSLSPGGNPDRPDPAGAVPSKFSPVTKSKL